MAQIDWNQPTELDPPWTGRRLRGISPEYPLYYIRTRDAEWRLTHKMASNDALGEAFGPDYLTDWDDDGFFVDALGRPCAPYIEDGKVQTLSLFSLTPNPYALALLA